MLGDLGIAKLAADRAQRGQRTFVVLALQPRIASNVSRQNRRQPALDPLSAHLVAVPKESSAIQGTPKLSSNASVSLSDTHQLSDDFASDFAASRRNPGGATSAE